MTWSACQVFQPRFRNSEKFQEIEFAGGVHFSAWKTANVDQYHPIVSYEQVQANFGGGFDSDSGEFTAPVAGLYRFIVSTTGENDADGKYSLIFKKNGQDIYLCEQWTNPGQSWNRLSAVYEISLGAYEKLSLLQFHGKTLIGSSNPLIFMGDLISKTG